MSLIENLGYVLLGAIAIISIFLIVLTLLEKKLHIKMIRGLHSRNQLYIEKISKINIKKPREGLNTLGHIAKSFFKESFRVKGAPEFSELVVFFKNKNNKKATQLCNEMTKILYSKEEIKTEKLQELVMLLAEIVAANKIITGEEQKQLDKKSMQKQDSFIKKKFNKFFKK